MLGILDIPAEVMIQIIQKLTRKDMKQCLLVNQQFYHCTINEFYSSLVIRTWNYDKFFNYHGKMQNAYDTSLSDKWSLVKRMKLLRPDNDESRYMYDCFTNLISIFSSLTFIEIRGSSSTLIHILKYMLLNLDTASLPHLKQLQIPQERICEYNSARLKNLYYINVCYKFRQSLTHLSIENPYSAYCLESYENNETQLDTLPFFKKLTNLKIYHESKMGILEPLIDSSVFSACQSLTHFSLFRNGMKYADTNSADFECKPKELKAIPRNIHSKSPPTRSSPDSNLSKLKKVSLNLREMNQARMEAILNNIPTSQLDEFHLEVLLEIQTIKWILDANSDDINRFLQHVKAAKRFKLITPATEVPVSAVTLSTITKLWRSSTTHTNYRDNFPFKTKITVDFDPTWDHQTATHFMLKNDTCEINLALDEKEFFASHYLHLPFAPYSGTEVVAPLSDEVDEMKFCIYDSRLHFKLNSLISSYSNVKKLLIELKPYYDNDINGLPNSGYLVLSKKSLASSVTNNSQEDEMNLSDRHCSFDKVSINSHLLYKLCTNDDSRFVYFPFRINTFTLKNIPVMQNDDFHFKFNFKFCLPELVLNFTSEKSLEECPIRLTVLNQAKVIVLDVLITTFLHDTPVSVTNPGSTLDKIASKYTISSLDFKKVKIYYQNQRIPIKGLNKPKASPKLRLFSRRKIMPCNIFK